MILSERFREICENYSILLIISIQYSSFMSLIRTPYHWDAVEAAVGRHATSAGSRAGYQAESALFDGQYSPKAAEPGRKYQSTRGILKDTLGPTHPGRLHCQIITVSFQLIVDCRGRLSAAEEKSMCSIQFRVFSISKFYKLFPFYDFLEASSRNKMLFFATDVQINYTETPRATSERG